MRDKKEILDDAKNWRNGGDAGDAHIQIVLIEVLTDMRDLLAESNKRKPRQEKSKCQKCNGMGYTIRLEENLEIYGGGVLTVKSPCDCLTNPESHGN